MAAVAESAPEEPKVFPDLQPSSAGEPAIPPANGKTLPDILPDINAMEIGSLSAQFGASTVAYFALRNHVVDQLRKRLGSIAPLTAQVTGVYSVADNKIIDYDDNSDHSSELPPARYILHDVQNPKSGPVLAWLIDETDPTSNRFIVDASTLRQAHDPQIIETWAPRVATP